MTRRSRPRTGFKRTILGTVRQFPNYIRLLGGLITDRRVSRVDKFLVAGALAYILMPLDLLPDIVPFLGQVDDIYLLMLAIERLIANAGAAVVASHWHGPVSALSRQNLQGVLVAASFFLPRRMKKRLKKMAV
ncbi:MAG TPA: YkvA family protein [Gemmatimonadaceae bacterium]|nr:YkvA family protein [Gemmatimonadaceae bacterium]